MDDTNVQAEGPDPWAEIAAELHRIAYDAAKLIGQPAPSQFQLNIQPHNADTYRPNTVKNRAATMANVDAVGLTLLGQPGKTDELGSGSFHHRVHGDRGRISLGIYTSVVDPAAVDPDDEIERLRARVAELEADRTGLNYTRADDDAEDPTPTGPREPLHTGGMTEGGLVDETPAEPVTVYFSFGHGQTDPDTGKSLLDHYVTIVGPSYDACRAAMFNSRFGQRWSFDYLAGTQQADEWIPRWTEHERIDLMSGLAKPVDETGGYWPPSVTSVPAADYQVGLIVGDTAAEQRDNAYAAYERDEAEGPTHHNTGGEFTACGLVALRIPPGHSLNSVREHVTCPNCVTEIRR